MVNFEEGQEKRIEYEGAPEDEGKTFSINEKVQRVTEELNNSVDLSTLSKAETEEIMSKLNVVFDGIVIAAGLGITAGSVWMEEKFGFPPEITIGGGILIAGMGLANLRNAYNRLTKAIEAVDKFRAEGKN